MSSREIEFWKIPRRDVQIFGEIGSGAWGTVAKGIFRGREVAVKWPHRTILTARVVDRLRREVRIMAQVRHPNLLLFIAAVFDEQADRLQEPPLIVTELLDTNLRSAYEQGKLEDSSKLPIFRDVACALTYLHQHHEPIIHRDVSAPNVLLEALPRNQWKAKLSDFGSANVAELARTAGEGAIIYSAPETFPHDIHDPSAIIPSQTTKIDVYSYGVLQCEVITNQLPLREDYRSMLQQVQRQWPFMHDLIISCTKRKPEDRPTMADVLSELNRLPRPQPTPSYASLKRQVSQLVGEKQQLEVEKQQLQTLLGQERELATRTEQTLREQLQQEKGHREFTEKEVMVHTFQNIHHRQQLLPGHPSPHYLRQSSERLQSQQEAVVDAWRRVSAPDHQIRATLEPVSRADWLRRTSTPHNEIQSTIGYSGYPVPSPHHLPSVDRVGGDHRTYYGNIPGPSKPRDPNQGLWFRPQDPSHDLHSAPPYPQERERERSPNDSGQTATGRGHNIEGLLQLDDGEEVPLPTSSASEHQRPQKARQRANTADRDRKLDDLYAQYPELVNSARRWRGHSAMLDSLMYGDVEDKSGRQELETTYEEEEEQGSDLSSLDLSEPVARTKQDLGRQAGETTAEPQQSDINPMPTVEPRLSPVPSPRRLKPRTASPRLEQSQPHKAEKPASAGGRGHSVPTNTESRHERKTPLKLPFGKRSTSQGLKSPPTEDNSKVSASMPDKVGQRDKCKLVIGQGYVHIDTPGSGPSSFEEKFWVCSFCTNLLLAQSPKCDICGTHKRS